MHLPLFSHIRLGKEKTVFGTLRSDCQHFAHRPCGLLNVRNVSNGNVKVKITPGEIYENAHRRDFDKGMF